jgi:hypothetical protein
MSTGLNYFNPMWTWLPGLNNTLSSGEAPPVCYSMAVCDSQTQVLATSIAL